MTIPLVEPLSAPGDYGLIYRSLMSWIEKLNLIITYRG